MRTAQYVSPWSPVTYRWKARWSLRNGLLRLHVFVATDPGDKIAWGSKPWKKIGS